MKPRLANMCKVGSSIVPPSCSCRYSKENGIFILCKWLILQYRCVFLHLNKSYNRTFTKIDSDLDKSTKASSPVWRRAIDLYLAALLDFSVWQQPLVEGCNVQNKRKPLEVKREMYLQSQCASFELVPNWLIRLALFSGSCLVVWWYFFNENSCI